MFTIRGDGATTVTATSALDPVLVVRASESPYAGTVFSARASAASSSSHFLIEVFCNFSVSCM